VVETAAGEEKFKMKAQNPELPLKTISQADAAPKETDRRM
jgi:hypothetical protein